MARSAAVTATIPTRNGGNTLPPRQSKARKNQPRKLRRYMRAPAVLGLIVTLVLGYVGMTVELTAQTYRLSADQNRHAALAQTTASLQQRLAQLESMPRLERAAAQLHMTDPRQVVVIAIPSLAQARHAPTLAMRLANLARWWKRE